MHRIGYENNRVGEWTDLFVSANMKKDRILILEIKPGMRYYIGPKKRQKRDGYIFWPVVKKKKKLWDIYTRGFLKIEEEEVFLGTFYEAIAIKTR